MRGIGMRLLVTAVGLLLASWLVDGIAFSGFLSLLFAALVLGFVNAVIRPAVILLTLPFTLITLGLFLLVVNAALMGMTAFMVPGFTVLGFWDAVWGSIWVSLTSLLASWYIGSRGAIEVIVVERHR